MVCVKHESVSQIIMSPSSYLSVLTQQTNQTAASSLCRNDKRCSESASRQHAVTTTWNRQFCLSPLITANITASFRLMLNVAQSVSAATDMTVWKQETLPVSWSYWNQNESSVFSNSFWYKYYFFSSRNCRKSLSWSEFNISACQLLLWRPSGRIRHIKLFKL